MAVLSTVFSSDGSLVVSADSEARVHVWMASHIVNASDSSKKQSEALHVEHTSNFKAGSGPIYALEILRDNIITGGEHGVKMWKPDGSEIACFQQSNCQTDGGFTIQSSETNALILSADTNTLFAGGGDNIISCFDVCTGALTCDFRGHSDYIHDLSLATETLLCSASEDGSVRLWDVRTQHCIAMLDTMTGKDAKQDSICPSALWVGAVAAQGDWLVCGGGACFASKWHIPSRAIVHTLPTPAPIQVIAFHEQKVLTAGAEPHLYVWGADGKLIGRTDLHSDSIFGLAVQHEDCRPSLITCGSGPNLDLLFDPLMPTSQLSFL